MPSFHLGKREFKTLSGSVGQERCLIERETDKAYLFSRERIFSDDFGILENYWFPKSQCKIRVRPVMKLIQGLPQKIGDREEFYIPDWLWEKRTPAKPMGID